MDGICFGGARNVIRLMEIILQVGEEELVVNMGVSKKSVSWTSRFVTMVLQDNGRRSDATFLVRTFWTQPYRDFV